MLSVGARRCHRDVDSARRILEKRNCSDLPRSDLFLLLEAYRGDSQRWILEQCAFRRDRLEETNMSFRFWPTESLCRNIFLGERVGDDSLRIRTRTLLLGERIPSSARLFRAFEMLVLGAAGFVYRGIAVMLTISADCGNTENYRIPSECCHRA